MTRWADERGSVTAFFTVMTMSLILCAGLVLDGGRMLADRRALSDLAGSAARAGAQAVSLDELRTTGRSALDRAGAIAAAQAYLSAEGHTGTIDVAGDVITVTLTGTTSMVILGLVGLGDRTLTVTESARTVRGVSGGTT